MQPMQRSPRALLLAFCACKTAVPHIHNTQPRSAPRASHPARIGTTRRPPYRGLAVAEAAAAAALYAALLTPVALTVAWAALLFARGAVPQYGVATRWLPPCCCDCAALTMHAPPAPGALVLLVGLGSLLAAWALALWRADGWALDCGAALRLAAAAAALLAAFEACAAFSSGNGVRPYNSAELFFAVMVLLLICRLSAHFSARRVSSSVR